MSPYINPANAVTASRLLTLPPFLYFVHNSTPENGYYQWATLTIIACGLLDKVDGLVARIFKCGSNFGALLDAITDAICYSFCLLVLAIEGVIPWWGAAIVLGTGGLNSAMRVIYAKRAGQAVNYHSYAMERLVTFVAFLAGMGINHYEVTYFFASFGSLMVVTLIHDAKRMLWDPVPA